MKKILLLALLIGLSGPALAEKVQPSSWKSTNGMKDSRPAAKGNPVISVDDHKNRKLDKDSPLFSGEKPVVTKKSDKSFNLKKVIKRGSKNSSARSGAWSNLNE